MRKNMKMIDEHCQGTYLSKKEENYFLGLFLVEKKNLLTLILVKSLSII